MSKGNKQRKYKRHLKALIARDGMTCRLCSKSIVDFYALSIDHKLARCLGGTDEIDNLQLAHKGCNIKKGKAEQLLFNKMLRAQGLSERTVAERRESEKILKAQLRMERHRQEAIDKMRGFKFAASS